MFDPNVMVTSIIKNMLLGVNSVVSNIPWWLWLIFIVSSVLTKKKSRRRKWGYRWVPNSCAWIINGFEGECCRRIYG